MLNRGQYRCSKTEENIDNPYMYVHTYIKSETKKIKMMTYGIYYILFWKSEHRKKLSLTEVKLNGSLNIFYLYFTQNKLSINPDKTKYMIYKPIYYNHKKNIYLTLLA